MSLFETLVRGGRASFERSHWVLGVVVSAIAFVWISASANVVPAHYDTARDWPQAVACANGNTDLCQTTPAVWFHGLSHGALWIRFLAVGYRLDLSYAVLHGLALAFAAIGAGFIANAARHHASWIGGAAAGLVYAPLSVSVAQDDVFWNPTLLPLPLALFAWALLDHARTGRATTGVLAAVALAVSCDLHLVCTALVPLLFVANVASARRLGLANVMVIAAFGGTLWLAAPQTWAGNLRALDGTLAAVLLGLVLPVSTLVGLGIRARWQAATSFGRSALLVAAMLAWSVAPMLEGWRSGRYFAPSVPAGALFVGWLLGRKRLDWMAVAQVAVGIKLLISAHDFWSHKVVPSRDAWTLEDLSRVAQALADEGRGGTALWREAAGLAWIDQAILVALGKERRRAVEGEVSIARAHRSELPPSIPRDWRVVELQGDYVATLRPLTRAVVMDRIEVCTVAEASAEPICEEASLPRDPAVFEFPPLQGLVAGVLPNRESSFWIEYRFDVDSNRIDRGRVVEIVDPDPEWRITAVRGVAYGGELPARSVTIQPGGRGKLVVARRFEPSDDFSGWLPGLAETPANFKPLPTSEAASLPTP